MKLILFFVTNVLAWSGVFSNTAFFEKWMSEHDHNFGERNSTLYQYRLKNFLNNFIKISNHNKLGSSSYKLGLTQFSHMNFSEFEAVHLSQVKKTYSSTPANVPLSSISTQLPPIVDWRKQQQKAFTEVKNYNSSCHAAWALASVATIETYYALNGGELVELSIQQVLDCGNSAGTGCKTGSHIDAYEYVKNKHPLQAVDTYKTAGTIQTCSSDASKAVVTVKDYIKLGNDELSIQTAVATNGPVTIAFHAQDDLHLYTGGVYDPESCSSKPEEMNHYAVIVGYESTDDHNYWIVRNSWGTKWGEAGYFYMAKDKNICGMSNSAAYPIVPFTPKGF